MTYGVIRRMMMQYGACGVTQNTIMLHLTLPSTSAISWKKGGAFIPRLLGRNRLDTAKERNNTATMLSCCRCSVLVQNSTKTLVTPHYARRLQLNFTTPPCTCFCTHRRVARAHNHLQAKAIPAVAINPSKHMDMQSQSSRARKRQHKCCTGQSPSKGFHTKACDRYVGCVCHAQRVTCA